MSATRIGRPIEVFNSVQGAAFFQRLLQEWRNLGAQVTCHEAISEEDYRARRGVLGRGALRWRMYAGFAWTCWRGARRSRQQNPLRVVTTNPFFAPALVAQVASGSGTTINLLYDLFPEALIQSGTIAEKSWMACRCAAITRYALQECAVTVFLGERLRAYAESTYGAARRSIVIPVGADGIAFRDSPPQLLPGGAIPQILYSGQMGSMHDAATLAAVWREDTNSRLNWMFHASGAGYAKLQGAIGERAGVTWGESLPDAQWQQVMKQAQVAFVTIAPGGERVVMPSKTYSALVAGQAILAVCRRASDLADLIVRHDCGWVIEPGDVGGLKAALAEIAGDPAGLWAKRKNAFAAGHRYYDMTVVAAEWGKLFAELTDARSEGGTTRSGCRAA